MKTTTLAIILAALLAVPAQAASAEYKLFHYGCWWPVHVFAVITTGPIVIITSVVQHVDDKLKNEPPPKPVDANEKPDA